MAKKTAKKAAKKSAKPKAAKKEAREKKKDAKAAIAPEGGDCQSPYCELYCSGNIWYLSGEDHPPGYQCPTTSYPPSGTCSQGSYTCTAPRQGGVLELKEREVPVNTGDYVLREDGMLLLIRARYDPPWRYFCPNVLSIPQLAEKQPLLAAMVLIMHETHDVVSATVNVKAWRRPE